MLFTLGDPRVAVPFRRGKSDKRLRQRSLRRSSSITSLRCRGRTLHDRKFLLKRQSLLTCLNPSDRLFPKTDKGEGQSVSYSGMYGAEDRVAGS